MTVLSCSDSSSLPMRPKAHLFLWIKAVSKPKRLHLLFCRLARPNPKSAENKDNDRGEMSAQRLVLVFPQHGACILNVHTIWIHCEAKLSSCGTDGRSEWCGNIAGMALAHLDNAAGGNQSCAAGRYENGWRSGCSNCEARGPSSRLTRWRGWRVLCRPYPPPSPALPPTRSHLAPEEKNTTPWHMIIGLYCCTSLTDLPFAKGLCRVTPCTKNYQSNQSVHCIFSTVRMSTFISICSLKIHRLLT